MDPVITAETLQKVNRCSSASKALEMLAHEIGAYRQRNISNDARLVWLIDAWVSGIGGRESADFFEGSMWEFVPELEKALATIGAGNSLAYLKKLIDICGGSLPPDEEERAQLIESKYGDLSRLDRAYRETVTEESARSLLRFLENQASGGPKPETPPLR